MGKGSGDSARPSMLGGLAAGQSDTDMPLEEASLPHEIKPDAELLGEATWTTDVELYQDVVRSVLSHPKMFNHRPLAVWLSGSRAYGLDHADSDIDVRGTWAYGLDEVIGTMRRDPTVDIKPSKSDDDADASMAEKQDAVFHEIEKFVKLAQNSNPDVFDLLYSPQLLRSDSSDLLIANRGLFLSKKISVTYGGYAMNQLVFVRKGRGGTRGVNHLKREKNFRHIVRLFHQAIYALEHGDVKLRVDDPEALRAESRQSLDEMEQSFIKLDERMQRAVEASDLPDEPDREAIHELLVQLRRRVYEI